MSFRTVQFVSTTYTNASGELIENEVVEISFNDQVDAVGETMEF